MSIAVQMIGAFIASVTLSILFEIPKQHIFIDGMIGALGWGCYLGVSRLQNVAVAAFCAAFTVAVLANLMARLRRAPATVFTIPGLLTLVPGASVYRMVYAVTQGNSENTRYYLMETLQISGMIAFAILIAESIFKVVSLISQKHHQKSVK